jgi:hypothetical protein
MTEEVKKAPASSSPRSWVQDAYQSASKKDETLPDLELAFGSRADEVKVEVTTELTWSAHLRA